MLFSNVEKLKESSLYKAATQVVFTNGCFDILHSGHVQYLQEARSLGDFLVLGLNSDSSVSRLKGPSRPIQSEQDRAIILGALGCVDAVIIFEEDTPLDLILSLRPQILVKGGDWKVEDIVGGQEVVDYGGDVRSLLFKPGSSTTSIVEKIESQFAANI